MLYEVATGRRTVKGAVGENYKLEGADTEFLLRTYGRFKAELGTSGRKLKEKVVFLSSTSQTTNFHLRLPHIGGG